MNVSAVIPLLFSILFLIGCKSIVAEYSSFNGETMGTTFSIQCDASISKEIKNEIQDKLDEINAAASTYDSSSIISNFNHNYTLYANNAVQKRVLNKIFLDIYETSKYVYERSQGAFDPTVMPFVNYWGFGYDGKKKVTFVDSVHIRNLLSHVGFDKINREVDLLVKATDDVKLDFSAIAKGEAVDRIATILKNNSFENYYVEVGGEVFAKGINSRGITWKTGISLPSPTAGTTDYQEIIAIENKGIATSGNYRNFYISDNGQVYSHTINPKSGFPERNNLLSATIIAPNCALADAFATACMVMGMERAKSMILGLDEIEGILIFSDENGEMQTFDSSLK